ncbi:MAG TPA: glucosyl-3-phosphoglycerate synthase [Solirubrobacteraceae bacterium]|nr:glucosyl-3-phosphoglycerate synthase [Solirubrobacteraceae bacterium]
MAASPIAAEWSARRTFHHSLYSAQAIAAARAERGLGVSVCLPARECGETVGEIVAALAGLRERGAIDEIVVVDAASPDGTARIAAAAGARVLQEAQLMGELADELGEVRGKGDAMWRALPELSGEIVCFLDADTEGFSSHYATGLIGPLVCEEEEIAFVKGFYRRPFRQGGVSLAQGGGRVNHLVGRPALELFYPQLAGFRQPLAGEVAARRELLERVPFATGYGVEIGMLIDVWREVGLAGMAQVDLEEHRNRHQSLQALTGMAGTVLATIAGRLEREGRLTGVELGERVLERPPHALGRPPHARARALPSGR